MARSPIPSTWQKQWLTNLDESNIRWKLLRPSFAWTTVRYGYSNPHSQKICFCYYVKYSQECVINVAEIIVIWSVYSSIPGWLLVNSWFVVPAAASMSDTSVIRQRESITSLRRLGVWNGSPTTQPRRLIIGLSSIYIEISFKWWFCWDVWSTLSR